MNKDRAKAKDSFVAHIAEVVEKHGEAVLREIKNKDEEAKE